MRREFFDTLRFMEPADAVLLDILPKGTSLPPPDHERVLQTQMDERYGGGSADVRVSLDALIRMRCVELSGSYLIVTPYGRALWLALQADK